MTPAPRVLVVDANARNTELATFVLSEDGVTLACAADAADALQQIPEFRPERILMDVQMPGIEGLELTRRLKADPATCHILIVAFTAFAMDGNEARLRAGGCDGHLWKPIDVANFVATVRNFITGRIP